VGIVGLLLLVVAAITALSPGQQVSTTRESEVGQSGLTANEQDALRMVKEGKNTFRFDTFGDEAFWGDALRLHHAIAGERFGGAGDGLSPNAALKVGLKVDQDALPADLVQQIRQRQLDLDSPATTVALLKLNAVVGLVGFF